jgi:hypothetical protein
LKATLVAAASAVSLAVVAILLYPRPDPPLARLEEARSAIGQASEAKALRFAPTTYRAAQTSLNDGWVEMGRQNGRLVFLRNYHRADSLLGLAVQMARQAVVEAGERIGYLNSTTQGEQGELEAEISAWREALNSSLVRLKAGGYLSTARLALETSRLLMEQDEYEDALIALARGRQSLRQLSDMLADYANDEAQEIDQWRKWVEETLAESRSRGTYALIVDKSAHKTHLVRGGKLTHSYQCELGYNSAHNKLFSGDGATPEGKYKVTSVKARGSKYYKALLINYPNDFDKRRFRENKTKGIISAHARIGGLIEIHGEGGKGEDWTEGCVALTNGDMDHLMRYVTVGTPVTIVRRSDRWP